MTFSDDAIVETATLAAALNLPGNPPEAATRLVNKLEQRRALEASNVPIPRFRGIPASASDGDIIDSGHHVGFPAVVKPATGNGGRHVHRVEDQSSLRKAVRSIRSSGHAGDLILERELIGRPRFPYGDYVSVECVASAGEVQVVTVTGRMPLSTPFRETGAFIPSALPDDDEQAVEAMAVAAAAAIGVTTGCLHIEIKLTPDGPRIIEVNGRVAGGGIADLVADVTGHSMFELASRAALGLPLPELGPKRPEVVAYQFALQPPLDVATVLDDETVPTLRALDTVRRVSVRTREAHVQQAAGSYGYLLMLYGVAADHAAIVRAYEVMHSLARPA
ncbi:ATP-grasp domain-containing protein [Smaragdicoccus niigatensis]|uniref:ATP-grasp domain-containing protein n=1 Tax=Smaragdicoccus niigatensis TaxID=359359 RepID=UPI00138AF15A|nr:ATP-grasp domain-containing protein [Smaragdicoccus niigatensis]